MNPKFWTGKRVFLTGHTGFKGSWLSLWLQSLGVELHGLALDPPTKSNLFTVANVEAGMASHSIGNICELVTVQKAMQTAQPDIVIHMAAQPLVRFSYIQPVETYATNVMGTLHVLESVRYTPSVKAVVVVTTDKCYENREWVWAYRENEPMGGYDPYSSSKACAELLSSAYRTSFFNSKSHAHHGASLATARAGNVVGGGDWAQDRLIPDILAAFEQKKCVNIRNPHAIRPWQHVLEPLRGYLTLAQRLYESGESYAEGWNFGPSDEDAKPVSWIFNQLATLWGTDVQWQSDNCDNPHEANYLKLDISLARSRLNWHPVIRLDDALKLTVDWNKQYLAGVDMRNFTLNQIDSYQELIKP